MLETYRDGMKSEDVALLDDITSEMSDSLGRVITNGGRALAIVERMQGLSVDTRPPELADVNAELRDAVLAACEDYDLTPAFDLDDNIGSRGPSSSMNSRKRWATWLPTRAMRRT